MPIRPENRVLTEAARVSRMKRGPSIACARCDTLFAPYLNKLSRFCSDKCRKEAGRPKFPKTEKKCAGCGEAFVPKKSMKAAYCSQPCHRRKLKRDIKADTARHELFKASARERSKGARYRLSQANFRARRRAAELAGTLTWDEWLEILERFQHRCAYCRSGGLRLTIDHVVALSKGGEHRATNVVPACGPCNSAKCDRDWSGRLQCL